MQTGTSELTSATVTIRDNESPSPTVSMERDAYTVDEGDGHATVTLKLSHVWDRDVYVTMYTADGTATGGDISNPNSQGMDYYYQQSPDYSPVKISAGQQTTTFTRTIVDDTVAENDEHFTIGISNAYYLKSGISIDPANRIPAGTSEPTSATITIKDNDGPKVQFKQAAYAVNEGAGSVILDVTLSESASDPVVIHYRTASGTARDGVNYTGTADGTITFPAGSTADQQITVPVLDDAISGGDTFFFVNLTDVSSDNSNIGSPDATMVTIKDDDTFSIDLHEGWNLISCPLVIEPFKVSTIDELCPDITQVMKYNNSTLKYQGFVLSPIASPARYDFDFMTDEGYLVLCDKDSRITFVGIADNDRSIGINNSWNMKGWSSLESSDALTVCNYLDGNQQIMIYDAVNKEYKGYVEGGPIRFNFDMTPGMGYLLLSDKKISLDFWGLFN